MIDVKFKKLDERAVIPEYKTKGSAGADLYAVLDQPIIINPTERVLIDTGLAVELPVGYELQIRPRSGLALKYGLTVLNTPGTIDSDYRGNIGIIVVNHSSEPYTVNPGERIAQMVINKYEIANFTEGELSKTERSAGGFGSTGK